MLLKLAQMAGGVLMYGWALWFVGALLIGALLVARDEWLFWRERRQRAEGRLSHGNRFPQRRECERDDARRRADQ